MLIQDYIILQVIIFFSITDYILSLFRKGLSDNYSTSGTDIVIRVIYCKIPIY